MIGRFNLFFKSIYSLQDLKNLMKNVEIDGIFFVFNADNYRNFEQHMEALDRISVSSFSGLIYSIIW